MTVELDQFFTTQDKNNTVYTAVIISHPAIEDERLIKDYIGTKTLNVDGNNLEFKGAAVEVPEQSILGSDDEDKGALSFNRIGYDVLSKLMQIDNHATLEATTVRILTYKSDIAAPQESYTVFVDKFNLDARSVSLDLTTRNLNKATRNDQIISPDDFPGTKYA